MISREIIQKYPKLFGESLICFECGEGWFKLLDELFEKINVIVEKENFEDFRILQVKEKFGRLQIFINYGNDEIYNLINDATEKSTKMCELCGKPGTLTREGWFRVLCKQHLRENKSIYIPNLF